MTYDEARYVMDLDYKLANHDISLLEYLDSIPDGYLPNRDEIRNDVIAKYCDLK